MDSEILFFFDGHMDALPLYETLERRVTREIENVRIEVRKSQVSFFNKHMFLCVSFARTRKKKECPPTYITVTLGLPCRLDSPRVELATEPYPNRWTHHFLISKQDEIDGELMTWIKAAADFSAQK